MKKVISALLSFVFFIGCSSSTSDSDKGIEPSKVIGADTTNWVATYVVNSNTWAAVTGPVKRVIFTDVTYRNDTAKNGIISAIPHWITDTFYLLPTVDSLAFLKDSTGRAILNPTTKKKIYNGSFRVPISLPKQYLKLQIPIPKIFKIN